MLDAARATEEKMTDDFAKATADASKSALQAVRCTDAQKEASSSQQATAGRASGRLNKIRHILQQVKALHDESKQEADLKQKEEEQIRAAFRQFRERRSRSRKGPSGHRSIRQRSPGTPGRHLSSNHQATGHPGRRATPYQRRQSPPPRAASRGQDKYRWNRPKTVTNSESSGRRLISSNSR